LRPSLLRGRPSPAAQHDEVSRLQAHLLQAEAFRILRANLLVALSDLKRPTVLITSAHAEEGKTSVAANLAVSLAAAGKRVGLVDLDLRHPNLHKWLGVPNERGAADVLLGRAKLRSCVQQFRVGASSYAADDLDDEPAGLVAQVRQLRAGVRSARLGPTLFFLPTGSPVDEPAELLSAGRTSALLQSMDGPRRPGDQEAPEGKGEHQGGQRPRPLLDVVLVDAPPVLPVADALIVGRLVTGALLVVEAGHTPIDAVQEAKAALIRNQTRLLGVVLNGRSPGSRPMGGTGYGYGYGSG
jgi:Mrp family chromosome partitioning ATPase